MDKYYIKEDNWEVIYGLLQTLKTVRVKNKLTTRKFLEAVYLALLQIEKEIKLCEER